MSNFFDTLQQYAGNIIEPPLQFVGYIFKAPQRVVELVDNLNRQVNRNGTICSILLILLCVLVATSICVLVVPIIPIWEALQSLRTFAENIADAIKLDLMLSGVMYILSSLLTILEFLLSGAKYILNTLLTIF